MVRASERGRGAWFLRTFVLVVVALAIAWTLKDQDWPALGQALLSTPKTQIFYASIVFVISRIFQTARFYSLCPGDLGFMKHIGLNMGSQAGIILLPFRAGELFRPLLMNRWNKQLKWTSLLLWLLVEKIIEAITLIPLLVVAIRTLHLGYEGDTLAFAVYAAFVGAALWAAYRYRARIRLWMGRMSNHENMARAMVMPFVTSILSWLTWWWLFYAFVPDFLASLVLSVAVILASSIPALPAGLGAFEASYVWVAGRWGVPPSQALASALVLHGLIIFWTLAWGVPYLVIWGVPKGAPKEE